MMDARCKICRRLRTKLFLRGERCTSAKCAMVKKAYPPGQKAKRRRGGLSEYGKELMEKQKLKNWYNLREKQFRKYVKQVLQKRGKAEDAPALLISRLESRLDNVIFRLGFAVSRSQARQLVSHRHFLVNGRTVNIPSYEVKKGDTIEVSERALKKADFVNKLTILLKKHQPPTWLKLDIKKLRGEVVGAPTVEEVRPAVEIPAIFEFYSR